MNPQTLTEQTGAESAVKNRLLSTTGGGLTPSDTSTRDLIGSYDPQTIMSAYSKAKDLTTAGADATTKRLNSEYGTAVEDTNIADTKSLTGTLEGQRGFAQMPVALNYMQMSHDKRIKDLTKQKDELLMSNESDKASKLSELMINEQTAMSDARTKFLNNYFNAGQDQRSAATTERNLAESVSTENINKAKEARDLAEFPIKQKQALANLNLTNAQASKALADAKTSIKSGNLSSYSNAVIANPALYETLTPTIKGQVAAELQASGYDTTALTMPKLTSEAKGQLEAIDTVEREAKSAQTLLENGLKTGLLDTTLHKAKQLGGGSKDYTIYASSIANLGAILLKARSGLAVTPQEYERIKPFIPLVTDDEKTAQSKITRFFEELSSAKASFIKRQTETPQQTTGLSSIPKRNLVDSTGMSTKTAGSTSSGIKWTIE